MCICPVIIYTAHTINFTTHLSYAWFYNREVACCMLNLKSFMKWFYDLQHMNQVCQKRIGFQPLKNLIWHHTIHIGMDHVLNDVWITMIRSYQRYFLTTNKKRMKQSRGCKGDIRLTTTTQNTPSMQYPCSFLVHLFVMLGRFAPSFHGWKSPIYYK